MFGNKTNPGTKRREQNDPGTKRWEQNGGNKTTREQNDPGTKRWEQNGGNKTEMFVVKHGLLELLLDDDDELFEQRSISPRLLLEEQT
uniref:Cyclic nucleotide-binding domain-containing protein n=1 Tax=Globodera rostochiensis TaxID=31243 RepID=A0A914IH24_GLORO